MNNINTKYITSDPDFRGTVEILLDDPNATGYCTINIPTCKIYDIVVHPRRQGFGSHLLSKSEETLKSYGCTDVHLYSLRASRGFYKKCGYEMEPDVELSASFIKFKKQL